VIELRRLVRLVFNPDVPGGAAAPEAFTGPNGYAGKPTPRGLARFYEFEVACRGEPDAQTGYLINIQDVDRAVRERVAPMVAEACRDRPWTDPASMIGALGEALAGALPVRLAWIRWLVTPTFSVEVAMTEHGTASDAVVIRQKFDFAAAHRLHDPNRSEAENRALFGKCNNPNGHGHNYQIEPAVAVRSGGNVPSRFTLADLERLTDEAVLEAFDHTNLNLDTDAFGPGGLNPSVEHIARVCYERLHAAIEAAGFRTEGPGVEAELRSVRVWETDRTSATYPG